MNNLVQIKNLSVGFQSHNKKSNVVKSISFEIPKGKTVALVGESGSGKTVTQHSLAKWSDADIIVYIGCGERGNEMTEVLKRVPRTS